MDKHVPPLPPLWQMPDGQFEIFFSSRFLFLLIGNKEKLLKYTSFTLKFLCLRYEKTYTIRRYQGGIRKKNPCSMV